MEKFVRAVSSLHTMFRRRTANPRRSKEGLAVIPAQAESAGPLLDRRVEQRPDAAPDGVRAAVEHVQVPVVLQLGEADDLAALVRDQRVPARHAFVPGGRVRDLGRPRPHLLRRVVSEVTVLTVS